MDGKSQNARGGRKKDDAEGENETSMRYGDPKPQSRREKREVVSGGKLSDRCVLVVKR